MKNLTLNALIKDQGCLSEYDPNSLTVEQANKLLIQFLVPKKGNKKISIASNQKNEDKIQKRVKALRDNLRKRKKQLRENKSDLKTGNG